MTVGILGRMPEVVPGPAGGRPGGRRRALVLLLALLVLAIGVVGGGAGYWSWATGASGPRERILVTIPPGATGAEVADLLRQRGVIRSAWAFRLLARFRGFAQGFRAGTYTGLTTNMTVEQALDVLKRGPLPAQGVGVVIPEGFTIDQVARRVQDRLGIPRQAFLQAARSGRFSLPPYLPAGTRSLEGFLFPKTYRFEPGVGADQVIARMLAQFREEVAGLPWGRYRQLGLNRPYDVVIVASMIEREARVPEDRARIARVIYNRLARGMRLQIDATVEYALARYKERLTREDLAVRSPYNTYLHPGLPPTPIANPGLASLRAALAPARGDWLYYVVVDRAGHHAFTDSYAEFLRLKAKYQG